MKKYFGSLVFLISFFSFGQNYVENGQSYEYNFGNIAINHVYEEGSIISPDLNKVTFSELSGTPPNLVLNDTYGYGTGQDVPSDWSIIESSVIASSGASYDYASNQLTYDGNCNEEITLKVDIDTDGDGSADISNVRIRYQIICDFTLVQSYLNSCTNTYVIQMNEVALPSSSNLTGDARYPCRDYELFLYTANDYQIDGSGVLYGGSSITSNNGQFDLSDLPIGNYVYYVDNQCNQTFPDPNNPNIFPATFSIAEGYNFGSNVVFTGFECYEDEESIVDITLTSVAYPLDSWSLTDSNGDIVYSNEITDLDNDGSINFATDGQFSTGFSIETISILITGLEPGSYTLNFIDNLGCDETNTFKVLKPNNPLTAVETIFNVTCPSGQNGAVQFDLSGGWSEPFTENPFYPDNGDNPIWGDYQNYSLINVDTSQTYGSDLLYFAQDYYTILYIELPAGNYVFTYDEIVANNALDEDIIYSCSNTVEFEITQPDEFVIQSELSNDAQCNDEPSGSIDILCVTGGTAQDPDNDNCFDYSYSWVASNGGIVPVGQENLQDLTGLMAGTYNVTITDDQGCTYSESFNIDEPDPLTIVYDTKQEVNCFGGADGSISVTVNGGTPFVDPNDSSVIDYDFTITKDGQNFTSFIETYNGSNSFILSGLPAGTYTIVVTDQNNCDADQVIEVVIEEPQEITYTIDQTTLLDCFGDSDGEITITVSGGTPGYSLSLTGTSTAFSTITSDGDSYTFTGLTVGSYAITIQDANFVSSPSGCDVTTGSLIINEPEELIISNLSATEILCNADETSTITGTITGGTTNYEVVLIGPGVNEVSSDNTGSINFTDLGSGVYIVQVSDTNIATGGSGCYVEQSITIDEPDQLAISQNGSEVDVTCFGENTGSFQVSVSGGTPNYIFTATDSDSNSIGNPVEVSTNVFEWSALYAGTYTIVVTDQNNCDADQVIEVVIEEPQEITYTIDQTTLLDCFGDSDGEITITVSGGTPGYSLSLTGTSTAFSTITSDGDSYTFTGLTVGSYAITIQDANFVSSPSGCDVTTGSLIINEPEELIISNLSATEILCNADETSTITGTITGGTTNYEVVLIGPGVNEVSSDNTGSINFTDLGSGVYIVQVSDTNIATGGSGCYVEQSITIDEPDQLLISGVTSAYPDPETGFGVTAFGATDGTIDITVEGGTLPYSFQWTVISGGPISGSTTSEDLFNLPAGVYSVIATDDNGCSIEMQFEITEPEPFLIFEDLTLHVDVDCYGASTGELGVYVTGGTAPYDFEIANTTGDTPVVIDAVTNIDGNEYSITGLEAGEYTLSSEDANNVLISTQVIILQPDAPIDITKTISDYNGYQISCFGAENGTISVVASGGGGLDNITSYTYSWKRDVNDYAPESPSTSDNLVGLSPGTYEVTVTDDVGCTYTETYVINQPDPLAVSATLSNYFGFNISINGEDDGSIDLDVSGGVESYTYSWTTSNGVIPTGQESNQDLSNLVAGTYNVTITDQNNCTISESFTLIEPNELTIEENLASHTDVNCFGASTGTLGVNISGGIPPYTYVLDNSEPIEIDRLVGQTNLFYSYTSGLSTG
ncbi:SprB repeat-containing protein, partial [Flavobacteriaceae bacterium]|nr:SprB repeat-containing protein [Flavobacteriaceae bacterium]